METFQVHCSVFRATKDDRPSDRLSDGEKVDRHQSPQSESPVLRGVTDNQLKQRCPAGLSRQPGPAGGPSQTCSAGLSWQPGPAAGPCQTGSAELHHQLVKSSRACMSPEFRSLAFEVKPNLAWTKLSPQFDLELVPDWTHSVTLSWGL